MFRLSAIFRCYFKIYMKVDCIGPTKCHLVGVGVRIHTYDLFRVLVKWLELYCFAQLR
jgi:hypothetical protein